MTISRQYSLRAALFVAAAAVPAIVFSADRTWKNLPKVNPDDRTVEMFAAIDAQEIEVKVIPEDETESRLFIKNKTNQPLNVRLPEAFAGVPVLAQVGGGGRGGGGGGGNQSFGGGMGGGMMGGGGMGGGMFNVAPEQLVRFKVATVCLEHGKDEPRPRIPYKIVPLDDVTTKPGVKELLVAFGNGQLNQRATQAAAWHLANDLSWEFLAGKRMKYLNGTSRPWFSVHEIQAGIRFARGALVQARKNAPESPGESDSLSHALRRFD